MNKDYIIYLDMDGVIVDLNSQCKEYFGGTFKDLENKLGTEEIQKMVEEAGEDFWISPPWMKQGRELLNFVKENFKYWFILSSPGPFTKAISGKTEWLNREIKDWEGFFEKEKWLFADSVSILIDDYDKNINKWVNAEGIGILHKDFDSTIKQLEPYL